MLNKLLVCCVAVVLLIGPSNARSQASPALGATSTESLDKLALEFPGPVKKRFNWRSSELKSKYDSRTDSTTVWTRIEYYGGMRQSNWTQASIEEPRVYISPTIKFRGTRASALPKDVILVFEIISPESGRVGVIPLPERSPTSRRSSVLFMVDSTELRYTAELLDDHVDYYGTVRKNRAKYAARLPLSDFLKLVRANTVQGGISYASFTLQRKDESTIALADVFSKLSTLSH
jgi:hypothetical protein